MSKRTQEKGLPRDWLDIFVLVVYHKPSSDMESIAEISEQPQDVLGHVASEF